MKKMVSVVCVIGLLLSTVIASAQASTHELNDEMQVLQKNAIIKGDQDGDFRPDDEITRAEFAAILCRAIGVDTIAETDEMAEKGYFKDVPDTHWAAGYINTAVDLGSINGFGDGTFRPEFAVTNEQAVKMLVTAWGYKDEAEILGGYPNGYMEIAKRNGMTDTVSFNYGIASKRWVACAFVYGALSMPADENAAIASPFHVTPIEGKQARPEHTGYVDDPVSILKTITPASAKYERTIFEQLVPIDHIPFDLQGSALIFKENAGDRKLRLSVSDGVNKQALAEGFFEENSFDLSGVPTGTWRCQISIIDGPVMDTYFAALENEASGILSFSGNVYRYTTLNAQPVNTEIRHELSFTGMESSELNPFVMELLPEDSGRLALSVSYPLVLEEGFRFGLSMNTNDDARELYTLPMQIEGEPYDGSAPIMGENAVIKPVVIHDLEADINYHIQISVNSGYGDDVVLKGNIRVFQNSGERDYLFEGIVRTLTNSGYEINSYTY